MPMTSLSESVLLRKIKTGDHRALDDLFRRYAAPLRAVARRRMGPEVRSKVQSMDVLQEVFLHAIGKLPTFEPRSPGALFRWFSTLIEHKIHDIHDWFRAAKRDVRAEVPPAAPDGVPAGIHERPGPDRTPSRILAAAEERRRIEAALRLLDEEHRATVAMRFEEGLGFEEIGRRTGRTSEAARKACSRAVAKLATALQED